MLLRGESPKHTSGTEVGPVGDSMVITLRIKAPIRFWSDQKLGLA